MPGQNEWFRVVGKPCFDIPSTSLLRDRQASDMARQSYLASLRHCPGTTASDNPCKGMPIGMGCIWKGGASMGGELGVNIGQLGPQCPGL